ncbi:dynein regulatory complex protein 12-like [Clavelina lepadiformis]|uniref:Dynein regulatory complex protein 12 n=1 Tax=Clavelina lepadiformis TaxID=159417 RepID=A0ABP0FCW4_CLALP
MPPKKKKGKGKKKGKKGKKDEAKEEDKFKKTAREIEILKDHLAHRNEIARRSQAAAVDAREKCNQAEDLLKEQQNEQKNISADLTRQYKTMQTELGIHVHQLEAEVGHLRQQLSHTQQELQSTKLAKERMEIEKNEKISNLEMRIDGMEGAYERVLTEALDSLVGKIETTKSKWEGESVVIQEQNKKTLLEFGLNHLDI